jgi:nucleoside-diphosphate-sugar epimerase
VKVLVTGAAGTLGREVVAHLSGRGMQVRAHDRVALDPGAAWQTAAGDLRERPAVEALVAGMDAVVHAAALPSPHAAPQDEVFANNVLAARLVLDAAGAAGVPRAVHISSLSALGLAFSAHGTSPLTAPVTEDHPYLGDDVYGLSKYVGETVAATAARRWGTTVVSLRFPFLGTGRRLADHLARVHADPGHDSGGLWGWLDSRDAARAVGAALTAPVSGHTVVNVAAPDTTALQPTADLLRRYHPGTQVEQPLDGFAVPFCLRRSRELLGFTALHRWRP